MTEWLGDTLIATTALLALVLLVRKPVARHFGAGTAYFLWALPAARICVPVLTVEVPAMAGTAAGNLSEQVRTAALAAVQAGPAMGSASAVPSINWAMIALSLWLGGAALLFLVQMYRYAAMREELLADASEIDRVGTIRIVRTDHVTGPLAFGLFSRYVAVPLDFARSFSPRERELALAHELAHHRGGDLYANMAAFLFLCLNWFNPLAWFAWSAFRFDQEAACDARVIAGADALTRQHYGRALARTATDGLPAFAMALNRPGTIIERLRRLMMKETSKRRRIVGKGAIVGLGVVLLPLTATTVAVHAENGSAPEAAGEKKEVRKQKVVIVRSDDGKPVNVDLSGDTEAPFVKTVTKDGKTIVLRSSRELTDADVEKMVADAEKSAATVEADVAETAAAEGGEAKKRVSVVKIRRHDGKDMSWTMDGDMVSSYIPDIEISELRGKCTEGQPVTTDVSGFDGQAKSRVRIVMCGKGQANLARREAVQGLREARDEIARDGGMPEGVRKDVMRKLEEQIERLEKQLGTDASSGDA